jgi:hypothetical protein
MYLGAKLKRNTSEDGTLAWGLSLAKYIQHAVRNVNTYFKNNLVGKFSLPNVAEILFLCDYIPKEDVSFAV